MIMFIPYSFSRKISWILILNYDASVLINTKAENEEECYLSDIWKDICNQANVEYDETLCVWKWYCSQLVR